MPKSPPREISKELDFYKKPKESPKIVKGKKYEELMKYMEEVEDEISEQFERSAQRYKRKELDDIIDKPKSKNVLSPIL